MNTQDESILINASITPDTIKYHVAQTAAILFFCIVTIPLMPIILPIVYFVKKIEFDRISCTLTTRAVKINRGVFNRIEKSIPLDKITDVALSQGPIMRFFNIEMVQFETAGQSAEGATAAIVGIENGRAFRDAVLAQRDKITELSSATAPEPAAQHDQSTLAEIRDTLLRIERKITDDDAP